MAVTDADRHVRLCQLEPTGATITDRPITTVTPVGIFPKEDGERRFARPKGECTQMRTSRYLAIVAVAAALLATPGIAQADPGTAAVNVLTYGSAGGPNV